MNVVFVDRDGVINVDRSDYVKDWSEFAFIPGSLDALTLLTRHGYGIIVITNQSVINKKMVDPTLLQGIHENMIDAVSTHGGKIQAVYHCPHIPEDRCRCRKPEPGLINRARDDYGLNLAETSLIGDSLKDMQCARRAGCGKSILVRTGHGTEAEGLCRKEGITPEHVAEDLMAAVEWLLGER